MLSWMFYTQPSGGMRTKFLLSRLIFIFISCYQLLTADYSCYEKKLNGIFIYPLKLIPVPNFSSLGWFSFLSAVNNSWQLLTAVTKKFEWDFPGVNRIPCHHQLSSRNIHQTSGCYKFLFLFLWKFFKFNEIKSII